MYRAGGGGELVARALVGGLLRGGCGGWCGAPPLAANSAPDGLGGPVVQWYSGTVVQMWKTCGCGVSLAPVSAT
eukprot:6602891-Pyramimonas_sp.AAC.2